VKVPADRPIGLDMNQFVESENNNAGAGQNRGKDLEVINEIMEQHSILVGVLQRRLSSVKVI
jgi:katanin p80 WD40 repeat-containing subunit B1